MSRIDPHHIHSLGSRCFTKKSAFNVEESLVIVVKFTFQIVFIVTLAKIQDTPAREVAMSHSKCILSFDLIGEHQSKMFYVREIVLSLMFADVIFRRERSDDRKYVCGSQATIAFKIEQMRVYLSCLIRIKLNFVKHLKINISEKGLTQRFDVAMTSLLSDKDKTKNWLTV